MPVSVTRGATDDIIDAIITGAMQHYQQDHPIARIDLYRQNAGSVRLRIINAHFAELSLAKRHEQVWAYLSLLPEDISGELNMLLLLTPEEVGKSLGNMEFEDPVRSLM